MRAESLIHLYLFGVALTLGAENIRMDALGTHLVENAIGLARAASSDPRYERIIQTYARAEVKKEIAADLGVTLHVQGRVNHGGCKVDPDYQRGPKEASESSSSLCLPISFTLRAPLRLHMPLTVYLMVIISGKVFLWLRMIFSCW